MKKLFYEQFSSSIKAILPITLIVLLISVIFINSGLPNLLPSFFIGVVLLVIGMCLFNIGADISMIEIGSKIGNNLTKKRKVWFILLMSFVIGFIITIAEPDLRVLATQVPSISSDILINVVGLGVGLFLLFATLRMLFKLSFSIILAIFCLLAFVIAYFTPIEFVPLAFDAGGVTTGPLSVPFIIALGAGLSYSRHDKRKKEDTFGMISFCSIGPVIVVLILGILYNAKSSYTPLTIPIYDNFGDIISKYLIDLPIYFKEVFISLSPIVLFFLAYNIMFLRLKKRDLYKIFVGIIYTYIGLSIFLAGVNIGFMPMGYLVGKVLADYKIVVVPLSMLIGYFIITSEPAVGVLTSQIEDITNGNIKKKVMQNSLSIAVALATGLSMLRVITGISIWYFIFPSYLFAILMMPFVPRIFTAIAFDSGGVASGTMTATFLLPFAIGIAEALNRNVLTDAFGLIAMVATIPLIVVQFVGIIYKIKTRKVSYNDPVYNEEIIDY